MFRHHRWPRPHSASLFGIVTTALLLVSLTALALPQSTAEPPPPATTSPDPAPLPLEQPAPMEQLADIAPTAPTVNKDGEKTVSIKFDTASWDRVLRWFSEVSDLNPILTIKPTGTVTLNIQDKTVGETIDLLNEALAGQKYVLVRRLQAFSLHPADEALPPEVVRTSTTEELKKRGKSEVVKVFVPIKNAQASQLAAQFTQLKSNFGEVTAVGDSMLILQDKVGQLQTMLSTLEAVQSTGTSATSMTYVCVYRPAFEVAQKLRGLLADKETEVAPGPADKPDDTSNGYSRDRDRDRDNRTPTPQPSNKDIVSVVAQESSNTVVVTGPAKKVAEAEKLAKELDVGDAGQKERILGGAPTQKMYAVPDGTAEDNAKMLNEVYKASVSTRIIAVGSGNSILVYALPADHFDIAQVLAGAQDSTASGSIKFIPLYILDPTDTAATLEKALGGNGLFVEAKTDGVSTGILLRGSASQITEAETFIRELGEEGLNNTVMKGKLRIIKVSDGSAEVLAEGLAEMLKNMGKGPVKIITPGKPSQEPKAPVLPVEPKKPDGSSMRTERLKTSFVSMQPGTIVDPNDPESQTPANGEQPLTITVTGGRLLITGEDEQALATVAQLARLLTTVDENARLYEIIPLKHNTAAAAAKVINEVFNGPAAANPQQQQGGDSGRDRGDRGGGGFDPAALFQRFLGGSSGGQPEAGRIRVVAETNSNSLIVVKASPLDLRTIRKLLNEAIDSGEPPAGGVQQTYIITLQYADAENVTDLIKGVYKSAIGSGSSSGGGNINPFFPFPQGGGGGSSSSPSILSVEADRTSNRIVLFTTEALYKDVKQLADQLDLAAKNSTDVVEVIRVPGLNPTEVKAAIEALQGGAGQQSNPFGGSFGGFGGGSSGEDSGRSSRRSRSSLDPRPDPLRPDGGRLLFSDRGKDAPSAGSIYDPEEKNNNADLTLVSAQLPQPQDPQPEPPQPPMMGGGAPAPSANVQVEALSNFGAIIVRGRTKEDIEKIKKFIAELVVQGEEAKIAIRLIPMEYADASIVVKNLTKIYNRLEVGAGATTVRPSASQNDPFLSFFSSRFGGGGGVPTETIGSLLIFPVPRLNAILLAAPETQVEGVVENIKRFDQPNSPELGLVPYKLEKASAQVVAQQLQGFFSSRYPDESQAENQIRITFDVSSNTVLVQASKADQTDIAEVIQYLDTSTSNAVNVVKVIRLENAIADEIAQVLIQSLTASIINPATANTNLSGGLGGAGGQTGLGGQGGQQGTNQGFSPTGGLANLAQGGQGGAQSTLNSGTTGITTKTTTLRFFNGKDGVPVESGRLEDVHIVPIQRVNGLLISAPPKTMELLEALINQLDVVSVAQSFVNVFTLEKADALATAQLLQQLFSGTSQQGGGVNQAGGFGGQQGGGLNNFTTQGGVTRPLLTLTGNPSAGANLIGLQISADARTNTLIVAGSQNDLDTINAIVARLESANSSQYQTRIFKLRTQGADDVAQAITTFLSQQSGLVGTQFQTTFQILQRNAVVVAEPVSNTLLVSAPPQLYPQIEELIQRIDASPPQVLVQVLIAEVQLTNGEEFGVELGVQSPVFFSRSSVTPGVPGTPGFNFNTTDPLPNASAAMPGQVGFQGLGNLGVGRSGGLGVGGFVFSAASDTVSVLVRALKTQGRIDILSRPQLTLLDNQTGFFQVGQSFPLISGSILSATGLAQQNITYVDIGIVLRVTPRISPDGSVIMRVEPQISNASPTNVAIGNGIFASAIDRQTVQTTVQAYDGQTLILGGLIRKADTKNQNSIPVLGDIPYIGALFRYRTQNVSRRELIFIMTPHIIRSPFDLDRLTQIEAGRMSSSLHDIANIHGYGMDVLSGPKPIPPAQAYPYCAPQAAPVIPYTLGETAPPMMFEPGIPMNVPEQQIPAQPGMPLPPPSMFPGAIMTPEQQIVVPTSATGPVNPTMQKNGFPTKEHGMPTVFAPPAPPETLKPKSQPKAKEGQPWDVFGK